MSETTRTASHRVVVGAVLAILATVGLPRTSSSQQQLQGEGLALDLLERLEYTRAGADAITASMEFVVFKDQYCLPPDPPSRTTEEQFLKSREAAVAEYKRRYQILRKQLLTLIKNNLGAARAVERKFIGNPEDDHAWNPWLQAFERASKAIAEQRKELESKEVVRCRALEPQQAAPDPTPPTGPGIDLPQPNVRPVAYPTFKTPFCSESDKQTVIDQFRAVAWDYYMNYQDARVYHDAIVEALGEGRGNASVLRRLLTEARKNLDAHTKALDDFNKELDRVRAMRVVECRQQQPTAPDPLPVLYLEPFVYPAVPREFCTQQAKDETLRQLESARNVARRNYERAAARITELGDRIAKGDNSTTTSAAFQKANESASNWLRTSRELDADIQRVAAMPVVECAREVQNSGVPRSGFGNEHAVKVGFEYNGATFTRFEGAVRDVEGVTSASSDRRINQLGVYGEVVRGRWYVHGGWRVGHHRFNQTFQPVLGFPTAGRGDVYGHFVDFKIGQRIRLYRVITVAAYLGPVLEYNNGKFFWTYPEGEVNGQRSLWSVQTGIGGFVEYEVSPAWNVRFGAQHVSLPSTADDHSSWNFSFNREFRIGGYERPGPLRRAASTPSSGARLRP